MRSNQFIRKILKGLGIAVLFLLVLELCSRTDDWIKWEAPFLSSYTYENLRIADSLGYHNRPGASFEKWQINSYGFRGPELSMKKPEGIIRVAVVGASESFGLYESLGMDYPAQMQRILDSISPGRFEVVNAACPGMSPPRIKHFFANWISRFEPDVLVYYSSPSFYLLRKPPERTVRTYKKASEVKGFELRLPAKISIVLKGFLPSGIQTAMREYMIDRTVNNNPPEWVYKQIPDGRAELFKLHVSDLVREVQNTGTKLILATHGTRFDSVVTGENRAYMIAWRKMYPHIEEGTFLNMERVGNVVLREISNELGTGLVDLNGLIPKTSEYYADHVHFTDRGATIVAKEYVAEVLRLIPKSEKATR